MGKKARQKGKKKERREGTSPAEAWLADPSRAASVLPVAGTHLGQFPDYADPADLAARLAGLSTVLQRLLSRSEAGEGLTRARLSALALLVLGGGRRLGELAAAEGVRPPTMTRLVRAMEADGLVLREPDPADRRSTIIRATPAGEAQLEVGRSGQLAPLARAIARLDERERHVLAGGAEVLERLLRDLGRGSGQPGG